MHGSFCLTIGLEDCPFKGRTFFVRILNKLRDFYFRKTVENIPRPITITKLYCMYYYILLLLYIIIITITKSTQIFDEKLILQVVLQAKRAGS